MDSSDQNNPLVTVYITNYNYAPFLEQSIRSVLDQTFQDFELIIIDDGSSDNSEEIIEKYRENDKVRIIYQQNKGLNATNNVAIAEACGKYIVRLDADDYLEPSALGMMVTLLEADPELGLVFPDYYYVDEDGNVTGQERRHHFDDEVTLYDQPAHGACTMVRLDFLKKMGGYDEEFTCQDGYELWIKFVTFYKVTNISRPLFSYRRHGNNLTVNEDRILSTRKAIKEKFVSAHLKSPNTLAIIPVRDKFIGSVNWPLMEYNGKTVLEHKVLQCLNSRNINHIVITSADQGTLELARDVFASKPTVQVVERSSEFAREGVSLKETIDLVLEHVHSNFDALATISLDYPFLDATIIDEAVNTLAIFKSDSVISTRADLSTYYMHNGTSLKAILDQNKYTRYEREALYKGVGGLVVTTVKSYLKRSSMMGKRIAHVLLTSREAFGVHDAFHFEVFQELVKLENRTLKKAAS